MVRGWVMMAMLAVSGLRAEQAPCEALIRGVNEFARAYRDWDGAGFQMSARSFETAVQQDPDSVLARYWLGVTQFHLVLWLRHPSGSWADAPPEGPVLEAAIETLREGMRLDPEQAEIHALLGTLYGMKAEGGLGRALWLGPRIERHKRWALAHGADNPRVQYLLGVCRFHTARKPADWQETLAILRKADTLFTAEGDGPAGPTEPRWGHPGCLTFVGLAHERLGNAPEAAVCFRRALELQPVNRLAREGLQRLSKIAP